VLMVGFEPSEGTIKIGNMLGLQFGINRFFKTKDQHTLTNVSDVKGVFFAGSCTGPKTITNTITDARAAASTIANYLSGHEIDNRIIVPVVNSIVN
jgi:heterodisulfide reductase subunit A